jgi:hypothetical protein
MSAFSSQEREIWDLYITGAVIRDRDMFTVCFRGAYPFYMLLEDFLGCFLFSRSDGEWRFSHVTRQPYLRKGFGSDHRFPSINTEKTEKYHAPLCFFKKRFDDIKAKLAFLEVVRLPRELIVHILSFVIS